MLCLESEELMEAYDLLAEAVLYNSPSSSALLPAATPLLLRALDGDMVNVHAIFRVNRGLTNVIQVTPPV